MTFQVLVVSCLICLVSMAFADELRVPAFTAYMLPNPDSAKMSEVSGISRWVDSSQSVNWYGRFETPGEIRIKVDLQIPEGVRLQFKLTMEEKSQEVAITGSRDNVLQSLDFGTYVIRNTGYHRIVLESLNRRGNKFGDIRMLRLDGAATANAHFNMNERRNAASVHLMYPVTKDVNIEAFYCEVTAVEDPTATFYMACGWHRGYLGMQVNSPTERRIIFSVWDSGNEAIDRKNVADDNRVKLVEKGEGVYSSDFGNEGTGGHSHLKYLWKTGETQRFIVTAQPTDETYTIFSGYWFHPEHESWTLVSSWKAPKEGGWIKRPHSFSENFGESNGHLQRKARYGNQWICTAQGDWLELTTASFSHDATGQSDRLDRWMGVEEGQFFLSHGGFKDGFTKFGDKSLRPSNGRPPADIDLPAVKFAANAMKASGRSK